VDQAGLVLWDLSELSAAICRNLAEALAPIHVGVIILTQRVLPSTRHLAAACGALQVVTASCGPQGLATALRLAALTQSGILAQWRELQDIRRETADRLVVEEAKRLVMRESGMGESQAMRWLQKRSRDSNQKMPDLARKILSG
jgi:response regulator NasT